MKKILAGLVVVAGLAVGGVLAAPGFIDWNAYKGEISRRLVAETGRQLRIDGDIKVSLLPAPTLTATAIRLANVAGASNPDMVTASRLDIRIAPGPLLGGNIQVESVRLVDPVVEIEMLADGSSSLQFTPPAKEAKPPAGGVAPAPAGHAAPSGLASVNGIQLDRFVIENGSLVVRDSAARSLTRIDAVNATMAAGSLSGPFESSGSLVVRGMLMTFDASLNKVIHGRTIPLTVTLGSPTGDARVQVSGTLGNLAKTPRFKGSVKGKGSSLADLIGVFTGQTRLPGLLARKFSFEAAVTGSTAGAEVKGLTAAVADTRVTGGFSVGFGKQIDVTGVLNAGHVDLDAWINADSVAVTPAQGFPKPPASTPKQPAGRATLTLPPPPSAADKVPGQGGQAAANGFAVPLNLNGSLGVTIEGVTYRGGAIRQVQANVEVAAGEITISQFSAQLPGNTDIAVFGFVGAADGKPRFDGEIEILSSDAQRVLSWLGADLPGLPAERLRRLSFSGKLAARRQRAKLSGLSLQFDNSRITGSAGIDFGGRPALQMDLDMDRINLDGYLPKGDGAAPPPAPAPAPKPKPDQASAKAVGAAGDGGLFSVLGRMAAFDADIKGQVKSLIYRGSHARGLRLDAVLKDGRLDIRKAGIEALAGASLSLSGGLAELAGIPRADNLALRFKARDLAPVLALAGRSKGWPKGARLGAIDLRGRLDGALLKPKISLSLAGAGGKASLDGGVDHLPAPGYKGRLTLDHPDFVKFLKALGVSYRPAGPVGKLALGAQVSAGLGGVTLDGLALSLGPLKVQGTAAMVLRGGRPALDLDLKAGVLDIQPLLPAAKTAQLEWWRLLGIPHVVPAATGSQPRWSTDAIDLSALNGVDAKFKLAADALVHGGYRLDQAGIEGVLKGGALAVDRIAGKLFGGAVEGRARIEDRRGRAVIDADLSAEGIDVARALQAASGQQPASGRAALTVGLDTDGRSVADMIAKLSGQGTFLFKGLDVRAGARGSAVAPVLELLAGLGKIGGGGHGLADVSGSFKLEGGIARSDDLALEAGIGRGHAKGTVDLVRWLVDVEGQVALSNASPLAGLLAKALKTPGTLPFKLSGALDKPTVKLQTGQTAGGAAPLLDKVLPDKGVGGALKKLLPQLDDGAGGKTKAKDLLKKLFKPQ